MRHRDLRTALAVEVVAAAFPEHPYPLNDQQIFDTYAELSSASTRRGAILNCAIHALITHDRYDTGHTLVESPDPDTFRLIVDNAIRVGESCSDTWDGWQYAWERHAERVTRHLESVCNYWVPVTA